MSINIPITSDKIDYALLINDDEKAVLGMALHMFIQHHSENSRLLPETIQRAKDLYADLTAE